MSADYILWNTILLSKNLKDRAIFCSSRKKIADEALDLEMQIMNYSYALTKHIPEIHAALISDMGMYKDGYTFKKYQRSDNETAHFETANPNGCNSFWPQNYRVLYNREETIKLFERMQEHSSAAIEFTTGGNPTTYSAKIYPDGITVSASEYAEWLFLALGKNVEGYTELCNRKESLILRIDKLNKKLERKAKEPVGFWETMFGAFADMFR